MSTNVVNTKKYGNANYWCFIEDGWSNKEVAIWKGPDFQECVIARAKDKYEAKTIIDALLNYTVDHGNKFTDKEMKFLEFACSNFVEPYATMASNAILWNDRETYTKLVNEFATIYK